MCGRDKEIELCMQWTQCLDIAEPQCFAVVVLVKEDVYERTGYEKVLGSWQMRFVDIVGNSNGFYLVKGINVGLYGVIPMI